MRKLQQELEKKKKRLQQQQGKKRKRLEAKEEKRKAKKLREDLLITNSAREYSDPIPADLLVDIFSRVPAKSIGRFRCVSKFWKSILRRPDFKELFLTKSVAIPRLFFVVQVNKEFCVFSSPQRQSPDDNSSLVATRYKNFPLYFPTGIFTLLCGLVFLQDWETKAQVICNPATGESITLPKVRATRTENSYFGFDPISKQFKVLCMTWSRYGTPNTHQVLTLGTGKRKWRTVQGPLVPQGNSSGICIDGVLYYEAYGKIVCFDFRFEKFSLINMDKDMWHGFRLTLFNYKGTLGAHKILGQGDREKIVLWVLEDAEKHKWSKRILVLPDRVNSYHFVGMTGTGEIVFTPYHLSKHSHILYYNMERKTFTRINIQGFEEFYWRGPVIHTFLDYVERMKFM